MHCADRLPGIARLTGIDINPTIIARNIADHAASPRLHFAQGDAGAWLAANPASHRALLSYGGVIEYFAPDALRAIFAGLGAHGPAVVALCEPVAPDHDLTTQTASRMFGSESSFSHNHAHLLRAEGFDIHWQHDATDGGVRWIMLLAERKHDVTGAKVRALPAGLSESGCVRMFCRPLTQSLDKGSRTSCERFGTTLAPAMANLAPG